MTYHDRGTKYCKLIFNFFLGFQFNFTELKYYIYTFYIFWLKNEIVVPIR